MRKLALLTWPLLVGFYLILCLLFPSSDAANHCLPLFAVGAAMAAVCWALGKYRKLDEFNFSSIAWVLFSYVAVILFIVFQPLISELLPAPASAGEEVVGFFDFSRYLIEVLKFLGLSAGFALGFLICSSTRAAKAMLDVILYVGGVWAACSIVMFIADPSAIYGIQKIGGLGRLTGSFSSANSAATLSGALVVMAGARLVDNYQKIRARDILSRLNIRYAVVMAISGLALYLTASRIAIIATVICLFVATVVCLKDRRVKILAIPIGSVICLTFLLAIFLSHGAIHARMSDFDYDKKVREVMFDSHLTEAMKRPLLGYGLGSFTAVNNHIISEFNYFSISAIRAAHNVYLQWFEECGAIGLFLLAVLNITIITPMVAYVVKKGDIWERVAAILSVYAVFLIHGMTDYAFQEPVLAMFVAITLGAGFSISIKRNANHEASRYPLIV